MFAFLFLHVQCHRFGNSYFQNCAVNPFEILGTRAPSLQLWLRKKIDYYLGFAFITDFISFSQFFGICKTVSMKIPTAGITYSIEVHLALVC